MPESSSKKPKRRIARILGVLLATSIAVGAVILVVITQGPKKAVSSPVPPKSVVTPQMADAKSEVDVIFRGKSFAAFKRNLITYFSGDVTRINAEEGQTVQEGDVILEYALDRPSMMKIHQALYPQQVEKLRTEVENHEAELDRTEKLKLPAKKEELKKLSDELKHLHQLEAKGMASANAVKYKKIQHDLIQKEIRSLEETIRQSKDVLARARRRLKEAEDEQKRLVDLLEWQNNRPYGPDSGIPLNKAFVKAPVSGRIIWMNPQLRDDTIIAEKFRVVTLSPMDRIVVRCKVHELDLVKLKHGDRGTVSFDALPDHGYTCKITRIPWVSKSPVLEVPADYEIECVLDNPDERIKEGLTCNVKVTIRN